MMEDQPGGGQLTIGDLSRLTLWESYFISFVSSLLSFYVIVIKFGGVMARKRSQT